jgi:DNA polymerase-3 subunit delta'
MMKSLEDYPWIATSIDSIKRRATEGRLAHALLLASPPGIGSDLWAEAVAQALLCQRDQWSQQCQCRSCNWFAAASHPDFKFIETEEKSAVIKVAQVQSIVDFVVKTSQCGTKVIFIKDAERMNVSSSNALLKTLEEPQGNCFILLHTTSPGRLLPTIRSRTQLQHLDSPTQAEAIKFLSALGIDQLPRLFAKRALVAPIQVAELFQSEGYSDRKSWLLALAEKQSIDVLQAAKKFSSSKIDDCIYWWIGYVQEAIRYIETPSHDWFAFLAQLTSLYDRLLSGANPNAQLTLETLLMDWYRMSRKFDFHLEEDVPIKRLSE